MAQRKSSGRKMRLFNGHQRLSEDSLQKMFLLHLNNIFSIKTYLVANLPLMAESASFSDLKIAILESVDEIKLQILRMNVIYEVIGEKYVYQDTPGVAALTRDAFNGSKKLDLSALEFDLGMLIHLRNMESMEVVYFSVLKDIANSLPHEIISQLLQENMDLAKDSKELYELITREYII